jgi:hypothetical protein
MRDLSKSAFSQDWLEGLPRRLARPVRTVLAESLGSPPYQGFGDNSQAVEAQLSEIVDLVREHQIWLDEDGLDGTTLDVMRVIDWPPPNFDSQ